MHLFHPGSSPRGLVLLAPGGGQDHTSPGVIARATRLTDDGYAVAVVRSLDHVPAVLAEHPGPVGFWGISHGARVGLPLLAAEPRISAAVLGLADGPIASAPLGHRPGAVLRPVRRRPGSARRLPGALRRARFDRQDPGREPRWSPGPAAVTVEESAVWLDRMLAEP